MRRFAAGGVLMSLLVVLAVAMPAAAQGGKAGLPDGPGDHAALVALFDEFRAWKAAQAGDGPVDYSPAAIGARRAELRAFQARLDAMGAARWDRHAEVDFLAVRAQMDEQDFLLHVGRPWARDPGFYTDPLLRIAFTGLPVEGAERERLERRLAAIPELLAGARRTLDAAVGVYADFAIHNLTRSDGVNLRHPWREVPPAGILGWYDDLLERARAGQPDLVGDIETARAAIAGFHAWLVDNRPRMTAPAGVGKRLLDWYLARVKYMPWTSDDILLLAERERERLQAFHALERHRNRDLPELDLPANREDYHRRMAQMDAEVRAFLEEEDFVTVPDHIPADWQEMGYNAVWLERAGGPNFWEQILYRDPNPDHWHAVIPGHRFDGRMAARIDHPIRAHIADGGRSEGWALYVEEAPLQLGFYERTGRARARELIYIFGIFRAVRTIADVRMQRREWSAADAADYWKQWTPYLDDDVARVDAEIYLRRPPGYGLGYTMGSFQVYKLLGDRRHQLGEAFDLRAFHDWLMTAGRLPVALLRYDLTGLDDEIADLRRRRPLAEVLAGE